MLAAEVQAGLFLDVDTSDRFLMRYRPSRLVFPPGLMTVYLGFLH